MIKVIEIKDSPSMGVRLEDVNEETPIFAKKNGKLGGMVIQEREGGWILKIGGICGATGYHGTRRECLISCLEYGYEFFVEE